MAFEHIPIEDEEIIDVTEAPVEPEPQQEVTTAFGIAATQGRDELKALRRMYNEIEDALELINQDQQKHTNEQGWMRLKNDPNYSFDGAFQELDSRVARRDRVIMRCEGTFQSLKQQMNMLQRMLRET